MKINRRHFIQRSLSATALTVLGSGVRTRNAWAADSDRLPIIDTHQHLWDLKEVRPPWLKNAPTVLSQRYATEEYLAATRGLNVVKAIYMEVDVAPEDQVDEARRVTALSQSDQHPTAAAVISGRPDSEGFAAYIRQFADSPYIKGVRQVLQVDTTPQGFCLRRQFGQSMELLGNLGLSFDICIRPSELGDALKLVRAHADTRFILDHCGNADPKAFLTIGSPASEPWHKKDQWRRDISALATCDNLVCKISGIVARAPQGWRPDHLAPIINHCLDEFGPDRVVFGGDWPVCLLGAPFERWVDGLLAVIADRPIADQRKLLHDNAIRVYRLE